MTVAGSVRCSFSSSSSWRDTSLCFFLPSSSASVWFFSFWSLVGVELLVAFRRCSGGYWPVELLWGATVALLLFVQRREPLFSFFMLIDTPFSMAALWQQWRGRPTVVLLFPSFFLYNFLSPSLCFFRSFQKISHPLFSPSPFVLSFPFCPPPVFSSSPLSFLFSPLSRSFSPVFLPLVLFSFPLYVVFLPPLCAVHPLAFIARECKRFPLQGRSNGRRDISRGHGPLITAFPAATVSPPAAM